MPEVCARCGEEVRWGWRPGRTPVEIIRTPSPTSGFWMHRDPDADHPVVLGNPSWAVDWDGIAAAREEYADLGEDSEERVFEIPPPEVYATPVDIGDPQIPQGAKNKINLGRKNGWIVTATYSRAARIHAAHGNLLGMSDYLVVRFTLDGSDKVAVACWVDGSMDFVYTGKRDDEQRRYIVGRTNDAGFKTWLKNEEETS